MERAPADRREVAGVVVVVCGHPVQGLPIDARGERGIDPGAGREPAPARGEPAVDRVDEHAIRDVPHEPQEQRRESGRRRQHAAGLEPGTTYFYRFRALGEDSPTGRTRTLPDATDQLRMAMVSCAKFNAGFFNA